VDIGLRINGKAEASSRSDLTTQLLLAHLPMLARPGSEDIFVLGLASGISCSGFLAYPIKQLTVADNCEPVTRAVDYFAPWNRGVRTNAVTRIRVEDARTVLKLEPRLYDVIVSEPSNPWFASIGSVFSREFYELAAKRLKPGGIMVQWFHIYEMHDGIVEMVLRTLGSVFPTMEIWDTNDGDIVLLASDRPWNMTLDSMRQAYKNEAVRKDLESIGLDSPEAVLARLFASQRTATCIAGPGPIQTDGFPLLEYEAPVAFFLGVKATGLVRFDERTWQSGFAPEERRRALAGLDDPALRNIFAHDTINTDLWRMIAERLKRNNIAVGKKGPMILTAPCVFDPTLNNVDTSLTPNTGEALSKIIRARAELQNDQGDFNKNAQLVRSTLAAEILAYGAKTPEKGSANFAAVAARAAILHREFDLASDFLALGLKLDPTDPEFAYLARLREREVALRNGTSAQ
jgi:spermidine synthase